MGGAFFCLSERKGNGGGKRRKNWGNLQGQNKRRGRRERGREGGGRRVVEGVSLGGGKGRGGGGCAGSMRISVQNKNGKREDGTPRPSSFFLLPSRSSEKKTKRRYFSGAIFPKEGESICEDMGGGIFFGSRLQHICVDGSLISNRVSSQAKKGFFDVFSGVVSSRSTANRSRN